MEGLLEEYFLSSSSWRGDVRQGGDACNHESAIPEAEVVVGKS